MKSLFQKIRQELLSKNKLSKYVFYALGEIILIVIGILVALQINNWNEDLKNKIAEAEFYCKILEDFELDRQNITRLYEESENKITLSKQLLIELSQKNKEKSYLIDAYAKAVRTNAFVPSKVAITDIISSGKLNLITNDSIKNNLIRYYAELDNLLIQLEIHRTKKIEKVFSYDSEVRFGFQEVEYVKRTLGNEILQMLPFNPWHLDSENKYYKQFQSDLVFFITMTEREKQHFKNVFTAMEPTYVLLKKECGANH